MAHADREELGGKRQNDSFADLTWEAVESFATFFLLLIFGVQTLIIIPEEMIMYILKIIIRKMLKLIAGDLIAVFISS